VDHVAESKTMIAKRKLRVGMVLMLAAALNVPASALPG
jgi:hypothetical protein